MPPRHVLMICLWPPWAKVGVRRPLRLARRLPALGWQPTILTPRPEDADGRFLKRDTSLDVPDVPVLRPPALMPSARLLDLSAQLLSSVGRPEKIRYAAALARDLRLIDQYTEWLPAAVRAARTLGPVDAIWATGSPYGFWPTALTLGRLLKAPVVLDYRDPWTPGLGDGRNPVRWPRHWLQGLEARFLRAADAVSFVTAPTREQYRQIFGQTPGVAWRVIPNGFAPEERVAGPAAGEDRPTLVHAGNCYGSRSLSGLLTALAALGPEAGALRVRQFGVLDAQSQALLEEPALRDRVEVSGAIEQHSLAAHLKGARALLLPVGQAHAPLIPGKLFDYWLYDRPILGIGPGHAAARPLIERTGTGLWVDHNDAEGLRHALRLAAEGRLPYAPRPEVLAEYSADQMALSTAQLLDAVSSKRPCSEADLAAARTPG